MKKASRFLGELKHYFNSSFEVGHNYSNDLSFIGHINLKMSYTQFIKTTGVIYKLFEPFKVRKLLFFLHFKKEKLVFDVQKESKRIYFYRQYGSNIPAKDTEVVDYFQQNKRVELIIWVVLERR